MIWLHHRFVSNCSWQPMDHIFFSSSAFWLFFIWSLFEHAVNEERLCITSGASWIINVYRAIQCVLRYITNVINANLIMPRKFDKIICMQVMYIQCIERAREQSNKACTCSANIEIRCYQMPITVYIFVGLSPSLFLPLVSLLLLLNALFKNEIDNFISLT